MYPPQSPFCLSGVWHLIRLLHIPCMKSSKHVSSIPERADIRRPFNTGSFYCPEHVKLPVYTGICLCACLFGSIFMILGVSMGGFPSLAQCTQFSNWVYFGEFCLKLGVFLYIFNLLNVINSWWCLNLWMNVLCPLNKNVKIESYLVNTDIKASALPDDYWHQNLWFYSMNISKVIHHWNCCKFHACSMNIIIPAKNTE